MVTPEQIGRFLATVQALVNIHHDLSTADEQIQRQRRELQFIVLQRPVWLFYLGIPDFFEGLDPGEEELILAYMQRFRDGVRALEAQLNERQDGLGTWTGRAAWFLGRDSEAKALGSLLGTAERLNKIFNDSVSERRPPRQHVEPNHESDDGSSGSDESDESDESDGSYSSDNSDSDDGDDASHDAGHKVHKRGGVDGNNRAKPNSVKTAGSGCANDTGVIVPHISRQCLHSSRGFLLLVAQASFLNKVWSEDCRASPSEASNVPDEVKSLVKDLVKASGNERWKEYTVQQWSMMGSFYLAASHQNFAAASGCSDSKGKAFGFWILAYWAVSCIDLHPQSPKSTSSIPTEKTQWKQIQRLKELLWEAFDICDSWFGVEPQQDIIRNIRTCICPCRETNNVEVGALWRFHLPDPPGDRAMSLVSLLGRRMLQGLRCVSIVFSVLRESADSLAPRCRLCSVSRNPVSGPKEDICRKAAVVLPRQDDHECYSDTPVVLACVCGKHQLRYCGNFIAQNTLRYDIILTRFALVTGCIEVLAIRSVYVVVNCLEVNQSGSTASSIGIRCNDEQHAQMVSREIATAKYQLAKGRLDACWQVVLSQTPRRLRVGQIPSDSHPGPDDGDELAIGCYQLALGTRSSRGALQLVNAPLSFQFTIPTDHRQDNVPTRPSPACYRNLVQVTFEPSKAAPEFLARDRRVRYRVLSLPDDDGGGTSLLVLLRGGRSGFIFNSIHLGSCLVFQLLESTRREVIFLRPGSAGFEEFYIRRAIVYPLSDADKPPTKPVGLTVNLLGERALEERAEFRGIVDRGWVYLLGIPWQFRQRGSYHYENSLYNVYRLSQLFGDGRKASSTCQEAEALHISTGFDIHPRNTNRLAVDAKKFNKIFKKTLKKTFETVELFDLKCDELSVLISLALRFDTGAQASSVAQELKRPI
ncbi:hypothetical protein BBAD15_g9044 [Beauveria bassiana D1-5]|uniref:Uncharacterized protein n=1 Tax=Beauveria bassiana D1-5 TaxID=1245745 RepID=A0A0A2VHF8_BEABA|nr:hypothetical protein BBAD15_g9044 [Beauveria bassiana D1-5]